MKLDDFLKCKKVRCVKAYGDCLTVGKEYGVIDTRMEVKVKDDEGDNYYWESDHFEPVLEPAASPLENMKLTPEFETEASEPKFKVGDKVYFSTDPDIKTISEVGNDNDVQFVGEFGWASGDCCCHATPENYERLQATFPDIKFKAPPKPLSGSDLARAMLDKGWKVVNCVCSDSSDKDALSNDECDMIDEFSILGFEGLAHNWRFAVPFDPRTGEPLTEAVLDHPPKQPPTLPRVGEV